MFQLSIEVSPTDADRVSAFLFELGVPGFEERDAPGAVHFVLYAESQALTDDIARRFLELVADSPPLCRAARIAHSALAPGAEHAWLAHLEPEWLTPDIVIQPASLPAPAAAANVIVYQPALAFGSGSHPTTRLAALALTRVLRTFPGRLLDVGTGNGVLAFVGLIVGAASVLGIDIDETSIQAARGNADLNRVGDRARFEMTALESIRDSFEVVVANIDAPSLQALGPALCARTQGHLVVTGFLLEQRQATESHFRQQGMRVVHAEELDDWCLLELRHATPGVPGL